MNKKILLITLVSCCIFMAGCGNKQVKQVPTVINQPEETFYGQWYIKKLIAYGPVGTYSDDDIKKILGKKLSFSTEKASCFGDQIKDLNDVAINPVYKKTVVSKSDFAKGYRNRRTFDDLDIKSDSIIEVTAVDLKNNGCLFYIKDDNTLILYGGGAYFELARENSTTNKKSTLK